VTFPVRCSLPRWCPVAENAADVVPGLAELGSLYAKIAHRLELQVERERVPLVFETADRAWSETMHSPPTFGIRDRTCPREDD